jgi:hypothetical protein
MAVAGLAWLIAAAPVSAVAVPEGRTELTLPFRGRWRVVWGGVSVADNYHGKFWPHSRYAYDFVQVDEYGRAFRRDGRTLTDYLGYGQPLLAPAAGEVVEVVDNRPDQSLQAPPASDAPANRVLIRHVTGEISELLHLQPASAAVKKGQWVARGQQVGRCGNSGYSSGPHLHYNLIRRRGGQVDCLLASFVWLWVRRGGDDRECRRWAPVRGETVWASTWANLLTQPSARPFHVDVAPGRLILRQRP